MRAPLLLLATTVALATAVALSSASRVASADAYAYGGASRRVEVDVEMAGFRDGAGVGGWNESNARALATFARQLDALLPTAATARLVRTIDDETTLTLYGSSTRISLTLASADYDDAIAIVARHLGKPIPSVAPATLYTVQLFASRSAERARRFARSLDERDVHAKGSFYFEACLPCSVPEAHVLGSDAGLYRVVVGIFDRRADAEHARAELPPGFVRTL